MVIVVPTSKPVSITNKNHEIDSRQHAFVVRTLVKFPHDIDVPHGTKVAKDDLIGADAYNRSIFCKKGVNGLALLKP